MTSIQTVIKVSEVRGCPQLEVFDTTELPGIALTGPPVLLKKTNTDAQTSKASSLRFWLGNEELAYWHELRSGESVAGGKDIYACRHVNILSSGSWHVVCSAITVYYFHY